MTEQQITAALAAAGIENARGEARILKEAFTGEALEAALARRLTHYPLQYIVGEWEFCHETYRVTPDCLIPRADTEILVEKAITLLPQDARFLDLCTGSGCIAISTLAARPDLFATAIDLFPATLALAVENGIRNGVGDRLQPGICDVLAGPGGDIPQNGATFDAILSNPPYIKNSVVPTLQEEVSHEPAAALCGGEDGLDFYRAILQKWRCVLKKDGFFLFEIGYDQGEALGALAEEHGLRAQIIKDYGGQDRVALLTALS